MNMTLHKVFSVAAALAVGVALLLPQGAEAKRFGGGKSTGKQSSNVTQKAAPAEAPKAAPAATPATPSPAAAAAAAPARNKWLGPLAGLAAGLGIAALLSSLGMGGALAETIGSMLMIAALLFAVVFAIRWWKNRSGGGSSGMAFAGAGAGSTAGNGSTAAPSSAADAGQAAAFTPVAPQTGLNTPFVAAPQSAGFGASSAAGTWTIPAGFDTEEVIHIAKMYFVRLQSAWDAGNEADLRTFTTPEMFAEAKLDLLARAGEHNHTEVVSLDAQVLGVEVMGATTLASVRLLGTIRQSVGGPAEAFSEVWNLEKPTEARASWVLAGIQQE